jgi:hypothetical protein
MGTTSRWARLAMLAALSPAGAVIGGLVDERLRLGFTIWRAACRAAGFSVASVLSFTLQLLPNAVIGALLGALLVQVIAFSSRHVAGRVDVCLAAHAGCAIAMPVGLILCAFALPVALMLLVETAVAVVAASVVLRTRAPSRA